MVGGARMDRRTDAPAASRPAPDERRVIEVEYVGSRRMDASFELEIRYPTPELVERIVQTIASDPVTWSGTLTLAGLTFDAMVSEVELVPQYEGDVLKVRAKLKPARDPQ
jgi:hypothetical protein